MSIDYLIYYLIRHQFINSIQFIITKMSGSMKTNETTQGA